MYQINSNFGVRKVATLGDVLVYMNRRDSNFELPNETFASVTRDGESLQIARDSYGHYGILQNGSARDIMEAMVKEIELFYVKPGDRVYGPHEMIRKQWEAVSAVGNAAFGMYPCFTRQQNNEVCTYVYKGHQCRGLVASLMDALFDERFGYGHCGLPYTPSGSTSARHEVHVAYALAQGKEVPEYVLDEYESPGTWPANLPWFGTLMNVPTLRGALPLEMLTTMCTLLSHEGMELTRGNAGYFIDLMKEFPVAQVNFINMDDYLYEKGILKVQPLAEKVPVDMGVPMNQLAAEVHASILAKQRAVRRKFLNDERYEGRMTMRNYVFQQRLDEQQLHCTFEFPNNIARALQQRNVGHLLGLLVEMDDDTAAAMEVLEKQFGVKLKGVRAEACNKAIFTLCGYDDAARAQYLQQRKDREAKLLAEQAQQEVIQRAEQERFKVPTQQFRNAAPDSTVSVREYVDHAIATGHTTILTRRQGNTQYWLSNARNGVSHALHVQNGSYDYAIVALEQAKAKLKPEAKKETEGE